VNIDDHENFFDNDILLGKIDGFVFKPSDSFDAENDAFNTFIADHLEKKIDQLIASGDNVLALDKHFNVLFNNATVAVLSAGDHILKPDFNPLLDERIQGIPMARFVLHLESWLKRQINALSDPLNAINEVVDISEDTKIFVKALEDYLGYVSRHKIDSLVKKVTPDDRAKLRKVGIKFAQYSVFVRDLLKPAVQKIKLILWALYNKNTLPDMPPAGVVSIPVNPDMSAEYYDIAGYKVCGDYAVRGDMIEKLADEVRKLAMKSDTNPTGEFEITAQHMSYVGKSGDAFNDILKTLGYNYRTEKVTITSVSVADSAEKKLELEVEEKQIVEAEAPSIEKQDTETQVSTDNILQASTDSNLNIDDNIEQKDDNIVIKEKEVEKNIWFWEAKNKSKPFSKKPPFKNKKTNSEDVPEKKPFKSKKHKEKTPKNKKQNTNDHAGNAYGSAPRKYKIDAENNPFAALAQLKKK